MYIIYILDSKLCMRLTKHSLCLFSSSISNRSDFFIDSGFDDSTQYVTRFLPFSDVM